MALVSTRGDAFVESSPLRAAAAPCRWTRTQFSISLEEFPAGLAAAPALRELRVDRRTFEAFRAEWPRLAGVAISVDDDEGGRRSS